MIAVPTYSSEPKKAVFGACVIGFWIAVSTALAQPPSAALDFATRQAVIEKIGKIIVENYVEPDLAAEISTDLQTQLELGTYDSFDVPGDLASILTRQLEEYDRHFHVSWRPPGKPSPPISAHTPDAEAAWARWSQRHNFGFERVARLPGNLGYLDLRYFDSVAQAGPTATGAMAVLANCEVVVVDLRDNGGGEPEMVQLLASYFFGPTPVHYNSLYNRPSDSTRQLWTLPHLPGNRLSHVPLMILTSARTGSAAEAFAYSLQTLNRATVIGQRTAGAANPGETFEVGNGFSMFVSTGKAVNPISGTNWEKNGVMPDLRVPADEALEIAQTKALESLLESNDDPSYQTELDWALETLKISKHPVVLGLPESMEFVGDYGTRQIRLDETRLIYQRDRRPERIMLALGGDRFMLQGVDGFRIQFERNEEGRIVRMVDRWSDGHTESNPRD